MKKDNFKRKNQNLYRSHVKSDDESFQLAFQRHVVISFNHFNHCVGSGLMDRLRFNQTYFKKNHYFRMKCK